MIAESYERIHRSNLVGMGIIPLQFIPPHNAESLGLSGLERYTINLPINLTTGQTVTVQVGGERFCVGWYCSGGGIVVGVGVVVGVVVVVVVKLGFVVVWLDFIVFHY